MKFLQNKNLHIPFPTPFITMFFLTLLLLVNTSQPLYAATAMETMQSTINDVLIILKDPALKGKEHLKTKKGKLWAIVDRTFNYSMLSRQALGRIWKNVTPIQQQEFTRLYSRLLGNTYMNRIIAYGDEKVDITRELPLSKSIAEVQTVIHSQSREIPVFYRLNLEDKKWQVFDVVIEGVSLTQNYRSQFKNFLSKKSMDDLLGVLKKKTANGK